MAKKLETSGPLPEPKLMYVDEFFKENDRQVSRRRATARGGGRRMILRILNAVRSFLMHDLYLSWQ